MSDEEVNETVGALKIPSKLLEMSSGHFKDRSKRRLSLPISGREARRYFGSLQYCPLSVTLPTVTEHSYSDTILVKISHVTVTFRSDSFSCPQGCHWICGQ